MALPDRSAWIVFFGIVEIALGAACLLLLILFVAVLAIGPHLGVEGPRIPTATLVASLSVYVGLAFFFTWIGVGTVLKRRWARTLLLSASALWLALGVLSLAMLVFTELGGLGELSGASPDPGEQELVLSAVRIVALPLGIFLGVVLPGIFLLFFRSPGVRATFETRDPIPRWTDRCPGPVLSMILALVYLAVGCLTMLAWNVVPFFGVLLTGPAASASIVGTALLLGWLAYGFYRLRRSALWATLVLTVLGHASVVVTFLRVSSEEVYRSAGIEEEQLEMLRTMGMGNSSSMVWMTVLSAVTMVAYLLYIRRYFRPRDLSSQRPPYPL